MQINLKTNSWHVKLYKWTYCAYVLPSSLCNYFWALLFSIASIPLTIWSLPQHWIKVKPDSYLVRLSQSLLTVVLLLLLIGLVAAFIKEPVKGLIWIGGFVAVIAVIIGCFFLYAGVKRTGVVIKETDTYKIFSGQAYSVKKKICPKINWK